MQRYDVARQCGVVLVSLALSWGCKERVRSDAQVLAEREARRVFSVRCSICHGEAGRGDGPGSRALNPLPRDYTSKAWQESVTDEQIRRAIVEGGAAVGRSPSMPASPDLARKPEVLAALVAVVRSFGE
jgi:mono/diheme cytochrome c family protein